MKGSKQDRARKVGQEASHFKFTGNNATQFRKKEQLRFYRTSQASGSRLGAGRGPLLKVSHRYGPRPQVGNHCLIEANPISNFFDSAQTGRLPPRTRRRRFARHALVVGAKGGRPGLVRNGLLRRVRFRGKSTRCLRGS